VSHSDPIKLVVAHYIGLHMDMMQRLVVNPASISELEFTLASTRLLRCNDVAHLPSDKD
jgi:broad specificity phosphatase PhoE